ncbi:MAG TPA: vanadium-dependent haloperoxidase, partial [Gemmatimonadaceae bacterium]
MMIRARAVSTLAIAASLAGCGGPPETDPRMVSEWTHALYGAVRVERISPVVASRVYAYAATGLYAGMAAANPTLPSLEGKLNGLTSLPRAEAGKKYDATISAVAAERVILDSLFRDGLPTTRSALARLADSLDNARAALGVKDPERSRTLGRSVGLAIVAWAHGDGFDSTRGRKYVPPVGPGLWVNDSPAQTYSAQSISGVSQLVVPTNPTNAMRPGAANDRGLILDRQKKAGPTTLPAVNMAGVTEPYWGYNRPFTLKGWDECPAPPPPEYSPKPGTPLYEEARHVYFTSKQLTPEQRTIALYWADNGGESGTPAGHWLSIASQMVSEKNLDAERGAWLLAQTSVSLADAFIAVWGYKFKLNLIRPRTFIRATMDSTWEPAIPTPPFPEYLSGHSTISGAAAA